VQALLGDFTVTAGVLLFGFVCLEEKKTGFSIQSA